MDYKTQDPQARPHGLTEFLNYTYDEWRGLGFLKYENYPNVPLDIIQGIDRYVVYGIMPGGFVEAFLRNDLMDACARADAFNRYKIPDIAGYIYNEIPSGLHGNVDRVSAWITDHAERRKQQQQT